MMITRENYEIWMLDYAEGRLSPARQAALMAFLEQNPDLRQELENFDQVSLDPHAGTPAPRFNLHKKQSWLLEKYSPDELVFHFNEGLLNPEEQREWNELVKTMPALLEQARKEKQLVLRPNPSEVFGEKNMLKRSPGVYDLTTENYRHYFIQYYEQRELALHVAIKAFLAQHPQLQKEFEQYGRLRLQPDSAVVYPGKEALKKKEKMVVLFTWQRWVGTAVAASLLLAVWLYDPAGNTTNYTAQGTDTLEGPQLPVEKPAQVQDMTAENSVEQQEPGNSSTNPVQPNQPNQLANSPNRTRQNEQAPRKDPGHKTPLQQEQPLPHMASQDEKPGNKNREKDSTLAPQPLEQPREEVADNRTKSKNNNIQTVNGPIELVSKVINTKYYEKETPQAQASNSFYAMRNVVHSVSGGEADVQKKEDKDYKSFSLKIGNFGFSRKKSKTSD